ncbi:hypothetical protein TRIATDRAFT_287810 [Trichoderma atroviride IMI 206040]|uniref:SET domain-containing protein n=1 Tax=Hypocrea atroviridis (strain ATCC 20476 / IMI 206040) TaxID=452589 RepID=G9PAQ5_HYPAI|nr:uncharacterized protein TRIATDRAFT_287810 [Trichoderma atroviride IMI 206040]EHK40087.1 hypothetical protein TRIATDRAFT_287810 [Trichoderma atroviride IMI 206040]
MDCLSVMSDTSCLSVISETPCLSAISDTPCFSATSDTPKIDEASPPAEEINNTSLDNPDNHLTRKDSPAAEFKNDFFRVDKSAVAGWGAFAAKDLAKGDVILREIPLFVATNEDLFDEFYNLDSNDMNIALSLHSHEYIKGGTPIILGIWHTNCFSVGSQTAGLYPIAARFNHTCWPENNVDYQVDQDNNLVMMDNQEHLQI